METLLYSLLWFTGIAFIGFLYFENKALVVKRHVIKSEFLPREFEGFTIVHLSDLHNKRFGKDQRYLIAAVRHAKPDIIAITGDIVDYLLYREAPVLELIDGIRSIAPIYYVSGNHEWARPEYPGLRDQLIDRGVHVLDNRVETIARNDAQLAIAGLDDHKRRSDDIDPVPAMHRELTAIRQTIDERAFKILLVHRPEWLHEYMEHHFNLIFAGHAHGGQWNLPFLGPVFAPGQGILPKLVSGIHRRHNTWMVVSRGLGNSGILAFQRLFNRPEVVVTVLKREVGK